MSKGATNKRLEAKIEAKLKEITKRSENRKCMDCREKGPRYVVLNFNIFVCSSCSGIHREFQHRAVGVSMSKFTMEQVKALDEGGNKVAKKLWMSRWDANEFPEPDPHDVPKIREFIRKKYIEKQWNSSISEYYWHRSSIVLQDSSVHILILEKDALS